MIKFTSYSAAAAIMLTSVSVSAQDHSLHQAAMEQDRQAASGAPEGANATFNFRKTFGGKKEELDSSFGMTMAFGQKIGPAELNRPQDVRMFKVMDFRFDDHGAKSFNFAGAQMTDFGREKADETQLNLGEGGSGATITIAAMLAAVGLVVLLAPGSDSE